MLTGFLPPEDGTGRGQGYFSYILRPRPNLATGTQIQNIAIIHFDGTNEFIATNQVDPYDPSQGTDPAREARNTIDADAPVSNVAALPSSQANPTFTVSWTGDDLGAGIAFYDIYVSTDGSAFIPFLLGTQQTSATFTGEHGRTYAFYSIATDNVRHREPAPAGADATITIVSAIDLDAGDDQSVSEGSQVFLADSHIEFAGDLDSLSGLINWGDGNTEAVLFSAIVGGATIANTHTYADDGIYNVTITIADGTGVTVQDGLQITARNVVPTTNLTGADFVYEGSAFILTIGPIIDPGADTVSQYIIHWGDGQQQTITGADLSPNRQVSHTFADGDSTSTIRVDLIDEDGTHLNAGTFSLTVRNVAPTVTLDGAVAVDEGSDFTLTIGPVMDPGEDTVSAYVIHWGDGSPDTTITAAELATANHQWSHIYADGIADVTISVDLIDEDGTFLNVAHHSVLVSNVAPTLGLNGSNTVNEGSEFTLTLGTVFDPGADTVSQYNIHWGDGHQESMIHTADLPFNRQIRHTYYDSAKSLK